VVKKRRRSAARRRRAARRRVLLGGGTVVLIVLAALWWSVWPYVLAVAVLGGLGAGGLRLWRTGRGHRIADQRWRHEDAIQAGHRTLDHVDKMTGTEFEELVASLCRRDGCTAIRRVGGSGDNGADVRGLLPDGRSLVVQCKRYTASRMIPARDLRDLLGAKAHFGADLAVFVTTTRFSRQGLEFAVRNGILAIHRDHLGLWNNGASLMSLTEVNGAGQGDSRHRARWKQAYGK
jgi:restriction system protein